ncbi:MAG: MFS transporter [archaeon]
MEKKVVNSEFGKEHPVVAKKINEGLRISSIEGGVASVSMNLGLSYISPFALLMNATSSQIGILHGVMELLPSIVQLMASKLIEKYKRKRIVIQSLIFQTLLWIPIILTGILFYFKIPHMVPVLIIVVGIFYAFGGVASPVWFSWMGSMVPDSKRGKYFSKRNRISDFCGLVTIVFGAVILDSSKKFGASTGNILEYTLVGFLILFVLAFIFRIVSILLLTKQYEPKIKIRKRDYFSFKDFLKKCPETAFGRFVLFKGFLSFAIGISNPFWTVYMLRNLGFSYSWFIAITVSGIVFQLIFLPLLGKVSDKFGNIRLLKICASLLFLTPLLWFASSYIVNSATLLRVYLLIVPSIVSGFAWAGYSLATNNYVYDAVSQNKRSFGLSYMNLIVGVGMFGGSMVGSLIAWLNPSFMTPILFIFLVSAFARFAVAFIGIRYLREVRHVSRFSSSYLVREFQPVQGVVREVHNLGTFVRKIEHWV